MALRNYTVEFIVKLWIQIIHVFVSDSAIICYVWGPQLLSIHDGVIIKNLNSMAAE